jgi:hypothetical protein
MAVLRPAFQVTITNVNKDGKDVGTYDVKAISQITVNQSSEKPCDSAEVHIPTSKKPMIKDKEGKEVELITPKDKLVIKFGYIGEKAELVTVFSGYVSWVSPELPLVIKAEDAFCKAKHNYVNKTYGTDSNPMWYSDIAVDVLSKADLKAYIPTPQDEEEGDCRTSSLELNTQTVAQAMARLSQDTEWIHFCLPGTDKVYFGPPFPYQKNRKYLPEGAGAESSRLLYRIGSGREKSNIEEGIMSAASWGNIISASGLKYQSQKPYRRVTCNLVDTKCSSKSVEGTAEVPEGEECEEQEVSFTAHYDFKSSKAENEAEAKRRAEERLAMLNSTQYTGSFTTFGNPGLHHSHIFKLESAEHPEKINHYYEAKSVSFNYSPSGGFRMTVEVRKPPDEL